MSYVLVQRQGQRILQIAVSVFVLNKSMEYHIYDLCRRTSLKDHLSVVLLSFQNENIGLTRHEPRTSTSLIPSFSDSRSVILYSTETARTDITYELCTGTSVKAWSSVLSTV